MLLLRLARQIALLILMAVLCGLAGATLVRFAPGYETTEQMLDARRSEASLAEARTALAGNDGLVRYYWNYLTSMARGDFGQSRTFGMPVAELIRQRAGATRDFVLSGMLLGLCFGLLAAVLAAWLPSTLADVALNSLGTLFLSVPAALFAVLFLVLEAPVSLCLAVVVFPRIFFTSRDALRAAATRSHVLAARARGVGQATIFLRHIVPAVLPQTVALAGISVSTALAADVPVEVVAGVPGIGQLAWMAASGRDLPVLVAMTLLLATVMLAANLVSDLALSAMEPRRS